MKEFKELLASYGIRFEHSSLTKDTCRKIMFGIRTLLPTNDKECELMLAYDFDDVEDFKNRINRVLPIMKDKGYLNAK